MSKPINVKKTIQKEFPLLGDMIKDARECDRRSLAEICRQASISPNHWYKIESGEITGLPIETLRRIESVLGKDFGVTLDD